MKLPKKVKVGTLTFVIIEEDLNRGYPIKLYGETDRVGAKILLQPDVADTLKSDTLMHEIIHAVWLAAGIQMDEKEEEDIVARIAPLLLMTLRENPSILTYLLDGHKP